MSAVSASTLCEAIQRLEKASSAVDLITATRTLAALAEPGAASTLMDVLAFNNPGAALAAVDGLIAIGPEAVPTILGNLDARNYGARAWAVRALAGLGDERGLEVLVDALLHDVGPSVRRAAARGLGELKLNGDPAVASSQLQQCLDALTKGCTDGEWVVRYAVVVGLERRLKSIQPDKGLRERVEQLLSQFIGAEEDAVVVRQRAHLAINRLRA